MRAQLGYGLLTIATVAAALGFATLATGLATRRVALLELGRRYVAVVLFAVVGAFVVMETALFGHDFTIKYVADNVARATPGLYTFTAAWGALEGSILLWALLLSVYVAVTMWRFRNRSADPLVAWASLVQYAVLLFFLALMLFAANPFKELTGTVPLDGAGPNALLQNHPLVAIHPPFLYAGYVGFAIPFSFAIAALVTGRFGEGWLAAVRRTTLVSWGFLTIGIVLGAWWSYSVLGWGGYWGWDPVENASLLPWLTATAFIHSVMVQERRGMLRVWNLSLVLATFCLTILGTFLTRSGVINSVHAFSQSSIGPWLLTFLGIVAFGSVGLVAWRGDKLRSPGRIDSAVSREAAFLLNNLLFAGFALVVLTGTVFPLLVEALQDKQITVGEPYFTRLGVPIGIALLFLMAVGPVLPWRAASGELLRNRLLIPAWAGALTLVIALVAGAHGVANVGAFALGAFAITSIGRSVVVGIRARRRTTSESLPVATARTVRTNPRLYGGLLVHTGVIVVAVALATTGGYTTRREVQLSPGESARVRGHTVTYLGRSVSESAQKTTVKARVRVSGVGELAPAISTFPNSAEGIGTPSIHTTPWQDIYLTLVSAPTSGRVTIGVQVGTMVMWLWIGGLIMALGTALALVPARKREVLARAAGDDPAEDAAPALAEGANLMSHRVRWIAVAVAAVLVAFGVVLAVQHRSEPSVPRLVLEHAHAPDFTLQTLDGKSISSSEMKNKTYVVNFFNSWCLPCQQEAPALKAFYAEHAKEADFAMIGIIIDDDASTMRAYVHDQGIKWPVVVDPHGTASLDFGTTGQPETYVIAPDGVAACGALGASSQAELDLWLQGARSGQVCA